MTSQPPIKFSDRKIAMAHGAGGEASRRLVEGMIRPLLSNRYLDSLSDAALLEPQPGRIALTTDTYVVQPLIFPGGSIGELAVNGTINDLAVSGARPIAFSMGLILEAGLDVEILRREIQAMAQAAERIGVPIVCGDTKVVEHGKADAMYINTTGLGVLHQNTTLGTHRVSPGDRIILSGPIGNHGMAIMLARAELNIEAEIRSDTRPLLSVVNSLLSMSADGVKWMRDATRGGVASVLNELARDTGFTVLIEEESIPVDDPVRGACELLGLDPLQVANEGQFVAVVAPNHAETSLNALHETPGFERACLLGVIEKGSIPRVISRSAYGGKRIIDMLYGDPLPRIC